MQISTAQWELLGQRSFTQRMAALLRRQHPHELREATDADLEHEIQHEVQRAAVHGLVGERAAATFVYAAWLFGPGFDERYPVFASILADPALDPAGKSTALQEVSVTIFRILEDTGSGE